MHFLASRTQLPALSFACRLFFTFLFLQYLALIALFLLTWVSTGKLLSSLFSALRALAHWHEVLHYHRFIHYKIPVFVSTLLALSLLLLPLAKVGDLFLVTGLLFLLTSEIRLIRQCKAQ